MFVVPYLCFILIFNFRGNTRAHTDILSIVDIYDMSLYCILYLNISENCNDVRTLC
jgi:hypothetical protein